MTLRGIRVGDVVQVDDCGAPYFAEVLDTPPRQHALRVHTCNRGALHVKTVKARHVVAMFRKSKASGS